MLIWFREVVSKRRNAFLDMLRGCALLVTTVNHMPCNIKDAY
jgi:hypothetical protein